MYCEAIVTILLVKLIWSFDNELINVMWTPKESYEYVLLLQI